MLFTQFRAPSVGGATLSKLWLNGAHICDICEDEVREIPGVPVSDWKIHGVTAIPAGLYRITLEDSVRFGPNTLTVTGVPGYEHIRIHGGFQVPRTPRAPWRRPKQPCGPSTQSLNQRSTRVVP
jgi:Family of unknown function (DUF5675)